MGGYGLLVLGPTLHYWFNFMSRLFPKQDLITTLKKMAMGQTIYGPVMTVVFFSLNASLQGKFLIYMHLRFLYGCHVGLTWLLSHDHKGLITQNHVSKLLCVLLFVQGKWFRYSCKIEKGCDPCNV